jgi:hypothetical protein
MILSVHKGLLFCLALVAGAPLFGQRISTRCTTAEVPIDSNTTDLRLLGCGEEHSENVLWHLDRADSTAGSLDGWVTRRETGKGAVVYVVDSGVRADHDEFARDGGSNVIAGLDPIRELGLTPPCTSGNHLPLDPCRDTTPVAALWIHTHGTAVASIIAGRHTGIAPDAKIVSVLAMPMPSQSDFLVLAFDAIIEHAWEPATPPFKTAIVSMSLPLYLPADSKSALVEEKMREMIGGVDSEGHPDPNGKRFLFVTLAGNWFDSSGPPFHLHGHCDSQRRAGMFPGVRGRAIDGHIVVGGITPENLVWERSCIGETIDVLAPATDMLVASVLERDYYRSGKLLFGYPANAGTSYATPYVAGLAALLLEQYPSVGPEHLEALIRSGTSRVANAGEPTAEGRVAVFDLSTPQPRRRAAGR